MFARQLFTIFASVSLFLIGCTKAPSVDIQAEVAEIRKIDAQWDAANRARDIDKIVSLFAPDAVAMEANAPTYVGHQAIRKAVEFWLADTTVSNTFSSKVDAVEVAASGDLAYIRGTNRWSQNTSKGLVDYANKWLTIYKKIDGKWKVIVDIGNSNMPASGQ